MSVGLGVSVSSGPTPQCVVHYGSSAMAAQVFGRAMGTACSITVVGDPSSASRTALGLWQLLVLLEQGWSRFREDSELSRLNRMCAAAESPVKATPSATMRLLLRAMLWAHQESTGFVDSALLHEVVAAGYDDTFTRASRRAVAPPRHSTPSVAALGFEADAVVLPPGLALDSGGVGKGLAADLLASAASQHLGALVDLGGDIRVGGSDANGRPWRVGIADERDPDGGALSASWDLIDGGIATSSITRRRWRGGHHLIDPTTKRPSQSDVAAVTVEADTTLAAETYAKTAVIGGADFAREWLPTRARRAWITYRDARPPQLID